ncbi:MAG: hypothetical protein SFZ23_07730 [Planctomycetota bacterium]|nr:hypothetical protein [Planctomycetota bacterium]
MSSSPVRTRFSKNAPQRSAAGVKPLACLIAVAISGASGLAFAATSAGAADAGQAEASKGNLPSAESLFEKYVAAIGGTERLTAIKSRLTDGMMEDKSRNFRARLTLWQKAPNLMFGVIENPGTGTWEVGFDGEKAWTTDLNGTVLHDGQDWAIRADAALFLGDADFRKRYRSMETLDEGRIEGRAVYRVRVQSVHDLPPGFVFFDVESGLITGTETMTGPPGADGKPTASASIIGEYKSFGDVKLPTRIIERRPDGEMVTTYRDIRLDVTDLPTFKAPADAKPAKPAQPAGQAPTGQAGAGQAGGEAAPSGGGR